MKFYIASGLDNVEQVRKVAKILRDMGYEQSYDWTTHGDSRHQGADQLRLIAQRETRAVRDSELFIALLPGQSGAYVEIGIAIADAIMNDKKQVWLWSQDGSAFASDEATSAFFFHPVVRRFEGDFSVVIQALEHV